MAKPRRSAARKVVVDTTDAPKTLKELPWKLQDTLRCPESLRAPAWRWFIIQQYLAEPSRSLEDLLSDSALLAGAKFYRERKLLKDGATSSKTDHRNVHTPFKIFTDCKPYGRRWTMEALIMSGASDREISSHMYGITDAMVSMYRRLFFDVRAYIKNPVDIVDNILSASRTRDTRQAPYDMLWKQFAWRWGLDAFINFYSNRSIEQQQKAWLLERVEQNMLVHASYLSEDIRNLFNAQAILAFQVARGSWDVPEGRYGARDEESNIVTEFYSDVTKHIDLMLMDPDTKLAEREYVTTMSPEMAGIFEK
jgi:hypothetical protein